MMMLWMTSLSANVNCEDSKLSSNLRISIFFAMSYAALSSQWVVAVVSSPSNALVFLGRGNGSMCCCCCGG